MSRYQWPHETSGDGEDDAAGRHRYLAPRRVDLDLPTALAQGRALGPPAAPAPAPELRARRGRGGRPGRGVAATLTATPGGRFGGPANGRDELWLPLGPTTVVHGQTAGDQRVAGRARALAVHPTGGRLYAATANGGVWYSPDAGATWRSIGGLATTDRADIVRPAHRHACGAIAVHFGTGGPNDVSHDEVFVGTGEGTPEDDARPGSNLGGVGVLVATNPVGGDATDPWDVEAPNLAGAGVYRLAFQPGASTVVAATSIGLFQRPDGGGAGVDWVKVAGTPFADLEAECTDVLWTPAVGGGPPARLWVWVKAGDQAGLWVRADGTTDFSQVTTTGHYHRRSVLAAADPPTKVYVFNDRYARQPANAKLPALFQVASTGPSLPTATLATGVPDMLGNQGFYDLAIAVHPTNPDLVALGGSVFEGSNPVGVTFPGDAAIFVAEVGMAAGTLTYGHATSPQLVGLGCHADVHDLRYADGGHELWCGCDGGVFRSRHPDKVAGFVARNDGLSVIEANYVASHPTCEGRVVVGLQDNGVIERDSSALWIHTGDGDGGGVVFDPVSPIRYARQYHNGRWTASDGSPFNRLLRRGAALLPGAVTERDDGSSFYSTPTAVAHTQGTGPTATVVPQIALGTNRAWFSRDWGSTWITLPTGTDPITATTHNGTQDSFGEQVRVCKWAGSDVVWVVGDGRVERLVRVPGSDSVASPGTWSRDVILQKGEKNKKDETSADGPIRKAVVWTDLAPNPDAGGAAHGPKGAVYLGTVGKVGDDDVDTLWWFDGTHTWHPTGLRTHASGVPAPVTAVLCDPANPNDVYVGTTVGVWYGERTLGDPPTWDWRPLVNGLPEAAVEDLSLFDSGGLRLLRAGIAARGVWEMRLGAAAVDLTFVRAHGDDMRYRTRAVETQRDGTTTRSWHASPDVRPRRAPASVAAPGSLPWTITTGAMRAGDLRRFQAALRSQRGDDRVRATGEWDMYFDEVLRDLGAPVAGGVVSVTAAFWNSVMVAPHATAEPWGAGPPTDADLYDFTSRLTEATVDAASCTVPAGPAKVDVVVHHRGLDPRAGSDVRVTLVRWIDPRTRHAAAPDDATTWFSGDVPWTAAANEVLNSAGGTTALTFGAGWAFVGTTPATRRQTLTGQVLDSAHSGVATFDLDLTGRRPDTVVILVAVIRAGADIALAPAHLDTLALERPQVAVRSLSVAP